MKIKFCRETGLPLGAARPALGVTHFPARWQAVLWRNWGLLTPGRLAKVLHTDIETVVGCANDMDLGTAATVDTEARWLKRGYITLIRQNWHLLPYPQLLELLGWTAERLAFTLKEDDFLWNKLGAFKPETAPVILEPLTAAQQQATVRLKAIIEKNFGAPTPPQEPPFAFIDNYGQMKPMVRTIRGEKQPAPLRMVYSYSAVYGDPLLDPESDPFPDGLLSDLAANGVNAVWLQGVLYTLVPWFGETRWSENHDIRIANLNRLVERAQKFGVGVYIYLNEPRAMPPEFFEKHPGWRGAFLKTHNYHAMCPAEPEIFAALGDGVAELFRKVPGLAGTFTITMSENLTHCKSKQYNQNYALCPRCAHILPHEIVASVNNAISEGAHRGKADADVIAWSWSWNPDWAAGVLPLLRKDIRLMCTQEEYLQTEAEGVRGRVADYTMSKVGPGFLAEELWNYAGKLGLERVAKMQLNNTWECSAVPYLPVPFIVKKTLRNLAERDVTSIMASWTLGGWPGGNLLLTDMEPEELAKLKFGEVAPAVLRAWQHFSDAFAHFPLHGASMLYTGPQNYGPMAPLFAEPTGYRATMVGFPYDDIESWRGILLPGAIFEEEFRRLSEGWYTGVEVLQAAKKADSQNCGKDFDELLVVAEAAYCHFRTTFLHILFIRLRGEEKTKGNLSRLLAILDEEIQLASRLLTIMQRDSRIGFEATNHYYYTEQTLKEKVLNCEDVREKLVLNCKRGAKWE